jgi:hypothetical protein
MTPVSADDPRPYDGRRGAAALILAVAEGRTADVDVILGCDPYDDRVARIAYMLALWFIRVVRALDASPEGFAEYEIGRAREQEARQ